MTEKRSLKRESLVATLIATALLIAFAYPVVQCFDALGNWVLNRSVEAQEALRIRQTLKDRDSLSNVLSDMHNWKVTIAVILSTFTLFYVWVTHAVIGKYSVKRVISPRNFWKTVGMVFSTYAVTYLINAAALLLHVAAISYAYSTGNPLHVVFAWIIGILSMVFFLAMLFVNGNQLMDESDSSLCTGLGIGESIYDHWVELQKYEVELDSKRENISSYISKTQYL